MFAAQIRCKILSGRAPFFLSSISIERRLSKFGGGSCLGIVLGKQFFPLADTL